MINEDNNGFVFFPLPGNRVSITPGEKTLIYLVAFESRKLSSNILSNINLILPGNFVSDDVIDRMNSNDVIKNEKDQKDYNDIYFPNYDSSDDIIRMTSIPMVSCICVGWSDCGYEYNGIPWRANYRDLSEEGKKLYYSMKKLHNSKEIRILTFNNI
mgnify:CR=1 FL=1